MGLVNASLSVHRLMEKRMGDMHLRECLIFEDDILIYSKTLLKICVSEKHKICSGIPRYPEIIQNMCFGKATHM